MDLTLELEPAVGAGAGAAQRAATHGLAPLAGPGAGGRGPGKGGALRARGWGSVRPCGPVLFRIAWSFPFYAVVAAPLVGSAASFFLPVALSTKARKRRSSSPACSRLAANGRALLMEASTAGELGNP